jgi:GDP-L-fucose synthase
MDKSAPFYVAGHRGLIGSAFVRRLRAEGHTNILLATRDELDLTQTAPVKQFFEKHRPHYVALCAARVGGIMANSTYPADFIRDNLAIQMNVIEAAERTTAKRVLFFGSSCMYPRECAQPMSEDILLSGKPEPTSLPYAIAKMSGLTMCLSYNKQYQSSRFLPVIPNNVFGPGDNFDEKSSHVLSALMVRIHNAKENSLPSVGLWGSGTPRREMIYVDDVVDACYFLLQEERQDLSLPLNMGTGVDISIKELAETIADVVGYRGSFELDLSKPDGAPRKLLDSSRLFSTGWRPRYTIRDGLRLTYDWYRSHVGCKP